MPDQKHILSPSLIFICLGNICRSPLAEGICREELRHRGLADQFSVSSAGTGRWHVGEPPHRGSVGVAKKFGLDISTQRSQHMSYYHLDKIPWIIALDEQNRKDILNSYPNLRQRSEPIWLLRQFENSGSGDAPPRGVPDPYYGHGDQAFVEVYHIIKSACEGLVSYISKAPE